MPNDARFLPSVYFQYGKAHFSLHNRHHYFSRCTDRPDAYLHSDIYYHVTRLKVSLFFMNHLITELFTDRG